MKIENEKPLRKSGECSICQEEYPAFTGRRIILSYQATFMDYQEEKNLQWVEENPLDLCFQCYKEIEEKIGD